jgi:polar amino acid transport system substrate-binding protein
MHVARWLNADKASLRLALFTATMLAASLLLAQTPAQAPTASTKAPMQGTLERIRTTGKLTLGYVAVARPLSYRNESGNADGYAVALCRGIAAIVKKELNQPSLSVQFVPVGADALDAVKDGRIDLLCVPLQPTLSRREKVSFSIPVFASGNSILMRKDAPAAFRDLIEGRYDKEGPLWRGSPRLQVLNERNFAVVAGTSAERLAKERKLELNVTSVITPVPDFQTGLQRVLDGQSDALIAERSVLLDLAKRDPSGKDVIVADRLFDREALALAMPRGDEDFRLLVDKTLSRLYRTGKIEGVYERHLGAPNTVTREWFRLMAEPE